MNSIFAGIDAGKNFLDVHVNDTGIRFENDGKGLRKLQAMLRDAGATDVVMEATGRYHRAAQRSLCDKGWKVHLVNPLRARRYAESLGFVAKSDRIDAKALAAFGRALGDLPASEPKPEQLAALDDRMVMREKIIDIRTICRQLGAELGDGEASAGAEAMVAAANAQVAELDRSVEKLIKRDPELSARRDLLLSIPGIGPVAAAALICWIAGARTDRQSPGRRPPRSRPVRSRQRSQLRRAEDPRRPEAPARRALHGRALGEAAQSRHEEIVRSSQGKGKAAQGRRRRGDAQARHSCQRRAPRAAPDGRRRRRWRLCRNWGKLRTGCGKNLKKP